MHLRLVSSVSKITSSWSVNATPTTAASGSPAGDTVARTPNLCLRRNVNSSDRVMVIEYTRERRQHMKRTAQARWQGDLKTGTGTISTPSTTLATTPYSFQSRFEQGKGTNPEELLAAAHAGCFTMALSNQLAQAGFKAESLETSCTISLEQTDGGFAITASD